MSKYNLILILIVGFAFLIRVYQISENPPSLNWDEVSHGYNAYSILKTGKDEWGKSFPLIFRAYGDYKLPAYIYASILPIKFFGLNPVGVRLISILAGSGLIIISYFLAKELTKEKLAGIIAGLLTAIMPWSLFVSRIGLEANLAVFFVALGWLLFLKNKLILTAIFWGLSTYTYNSARVLVPFFCLLVLVKLWRQKDFRRLVGVLGIFALFFVPIFIQFFNQAGRARFYWVNIIDQGVVNQINERRGRTNLPAPISRVLFNRPTYFITISAANYLKHFSPSWWFLRGGDHYQFSFPGHPLIFLVSAPLLIIGIFNLILTPNSKLRILIFWFLISFLPSAITKDSPHVLRSILVLPLPMVFTAIGVISVKNWIKNKSKFKGMAIVIVFLAINLVSFGVWWDQYWKIYPENYSWAWQYGYQQAVNYVKNNYSKYDRIIFTKKYGEPHAFLLFHWPWEPSYYQNDPTKVWDYHAHWYWVDAFDKFEFWNDWEIQEKLKANSYQLKVLLVTSPGNYVEGGQVVKTIDFLHGDTAFEIISYEN